MSRIVVVSGNPRSGSRTLALASAVGTAISERVGGAISERVGRAISERVGGAISERVGGEAPSTVDVGELGAGLLVPGDPATAAAVSALTEADILVVATPTYKGSYTGVLKVLLDQLPARALVGIRAVPVVTAGVPPQAAAAEDLLRRLLGELGADVVDPGLAVVESDLGDSAAIAEKYAAGHDW
jgi:FMN reductase